MTEVAPAPPRRGTVRRRRKCGKRGRPRVLKRRHREVICALVYAGCSRDEAAEYVGCSPRTIANQLRRDERFADQMRTALARREIGPMSRLTREGRRSWRAAVWLLERINPKRFGRQRWHTVSWAKVQAVLNDLIEAGQRASRKGGKK